MLFKVFAGVGFPPGSWNKEIAFKKQVEDTGCLKGLIAIIV